MLNISHAHALGTGLYTPMGGILENTAGSDLIVTNPVTVQSGGFYYGGTNNNLTFSQPVNLNAASRNTRVFGTHSWIFAAGATSSGGAINKDQGVGTLQLQGTSTFTGSMTVSAGTLQVDGTASSSSGTTVNSGGTLIGSGTVSTVTLNSGGTISAGSGVGALNSGNQTWNGGSTNVWDFSDAAGSAGTGYDTFNMAGALTIGATPVNPMTLKITGTPANFPGSGSWTVATNTAVNNFDYRSIVIDTTALTATLNPNKAFRLAVVPGTGLVLTYGDPAITADATNSIVGHGTNAIFNVSAVGASLSYQWQKNGINISGGNITGETTSSLTVGNVSDSDLGSYSVIVTDSTIPASVTSASATLDIVDAPVITVQPASQTVGVNTNAQFIVIWNGSSDDIAKGYTKFQWRTNGVNLANTSRYQGVTTSNLTVVTAQLTNAASYTVVLSNLFGMVTNTAAVLGVDTIPTITLPPVGHIISPYGGWTNELVRAAGGDLSYRWWITNAVTTNALLEDPLNYIGTTATNLVITNAVDTNSGGYFAIVTNYAGSVTSAVAVVSIPVDPVVASSPASRSAVTGTTTVFTAVASGKPTLLYHWKKDGVNLVDDGTHVIGAHTASLTLTNLTTADTAITPGYVLEVTNDFDNPIPANTTPATLTVFDPIIIGATLANGNPGTTTYTNTNPINLTAPTTAGTGPFSYQWRKGAVNVGNGANITGSATSSMTIASAVLTNAGSYSLVVSNYAGAVTSSPQAVLVINQLPHITVEPVSVIVDVAGKTNTFTVVATGFPLNYQWYFNSNIIAGATSASYTIPSVSSANIGYYHVVVSNLMGSEKSDVVTLKIGQFFFFDALTNSSSAANWNIYTNRSDSTVTWGFDYSLHNDDFGPGIPQNPNSTNTTTALKLTINSSGTNNGSSMTLVPKTINATGDYQFSFDVFMNFLGGAGTPGSQTAQSMTAALGCVANITNGLSGTSNGVVAFANCDNALSADDYAMYENTSAGSGSSKAPLSDLVAGTGYHINSYYAFVSASNTVTFPTNEVHSLLDGSDSQTRPLPYDVGTFGLAWHHVLIQRSGSGTGTTTVTYYIDGKPVGTVTNAFFGNTANAINIGLLANFAGGGSTNWEFTLFNNIKVESFTNAGVAPTITTPVGNVTVNAGSAGIFTVTATNDPMAALRYQWAKGGVNLSNGGKISGATSSALTISGALAADAGSYTVTVLNDSDFVNGGTGVLTVIDPVITVQPTNTVVECSSNAVLSVTAAGTGPITYQWFTPDANGALVSGATASSLTITNANGSSSYAVVVTGNQGSVTSSVVTVSTVDTTGPDITVLGSNPATVECHTAYVEAGATANDGCVGNVNGSITISGTVLTNTVGNYTVTYSATDGTNPSSATRVVHVVDMTAPVVTLNPGANTVTQDTPYTDPGATSADTCSASLITHTLGTVDTSVAGHYTLTYTATDPSGNLGSALRAVSVIPVPVVITGGPTPTSSTNAQGTNFTLAVTTTGSHPLTYQWYTVEGSNAIVAGVTGASPTNFVAQPVLTPAVGDKFATNHYFVIVTGTGNSATSSVARVVIVLDTVHPTAPTVTSPIKNKGTTHVSLIGTAKDTKGDVAHVYYKYVNLNPGSAPSLTNGPINEAILAGTPASRTFTGSAQPLLPGTNNLMVWSVDLAGNISLTNTLQFFYAVPMQFTLNKLGDGSGTVAWKGLLKDKGLVQFGTNVQAQQIPLNVGETYTLTYTPDKAAGLSKGVLAGTNIVVSVLTNTAGLNPGTNSTIKIVDASFLLQSNQTSLNLEFDRNRFYDMAGTYNAVFTASPTPSVASARYLLLTVAAKGGLASGSMLHPDALKTKDTFTKIQFKPDGSVTITAGGVTVTGSLAWNGSEDTNAVKQFIGQATDGNWTAPVIADLADKTVLQTPGLATMQIPAVNGGPAGTGFATVKLAGGAVTATYTLADDDKDPASWKMTGSRSGRVPQFVVTKAGDVLLGTLNVNDGLTTIVGTNLTWMHPAGSVNPKYASMLTAGFTNSPFDAICSPFTPASVTGAFTLAINGGNVISNVNQVVNFTAGTVANTSLLTKSGHVSGGKIDATGKITITFLDGAPKSHPTTAVGVVLQNATNNGAGFFIFAPTTTFPTNSGTMTLTPQ
ncbi:MAG: beta strand repeat-containing protein [Limisphaerales bacterium]